MPLVDIPYVGEVDFPDSMSGEQIATASRRLYDTRKPSDFPATTVSPSAPRIGAEGEGGLYELRVKSVEGIPITRTPTQIQADIERLNAESLRELDLEHPSVAIPTEVPGTELPKTPIQLPRFTADERASVLAKAGVGLYNVGAGLVEFPLNPEGAALTASTAGAGAAGGAVSRAAGFLWGAYGVKETPRLVQEAQKAIETGTPQQKTEALAALGVNTLITFSGAKGALAPKTMEALGEAPARSVETEAALGGQPIRETIAAPTERTLLMEPAMMGQVRPGDILPGTEAQPPNPKRRVVSLEDLEAIESEVEKQQPKVPETPQPVSEPIPPPENAPTAPQQAPAGVPALPDIIREAINARRPVTAQAVDLYGETLPEGYVREGNRYVYKPSPAPLPEQPVKAAEAPTTQKAVQFYESFPDKQAAQNQLETFSKMDGFLGGRVLEPGAGKPGFKTQAFFESGKGYEQQEGARNVVIPSGQRGHLLGESDLIKPAQAAEAKPSIPTEGQLPEGIATEATPPKAAVEPEPAISFPGLGSLREADATPMRLGQIRKSKPELWKAITQMFGTDKPAQIGKMAKARLQLMKDLGGTPPPEPAGPTPALGEVGMGGAKPAEFRAGSMPTATKNATVDRERIERGLEPLMSEAKRDWGTVWDQAMGKIDADPRIQDDLIASLKKNPRPLASDVEKAMMLHRRIELRNEYARQSRELAQAYDDAQLFPNRLEAVERHKALLQEASDKLQELEEVLRRTGTETARALAIRKAFANDEFELVQMELDARAARGGRPLTDQERTDLIKAHQRIAELQKQYDDLVQDNAKKARTDEAINKKAKLDIEKKKWKKQLEEERRKQRTTRQKAISTAQEVLDLSREMMTSADLSAVLRQGNFIVLGHPLRASKSIVPMLKAFASEEGAARVKAEIESRPNAQNGRYNSSGLALTDYEGALSKTEEAIRSRWAGRLPLIAGSQRAYVTFLNKLRADSFDTMVKNLESGGPALSPKELSAIADFINIATGRADLGRFNKSADLLSTVFFSPRFQASRFQLLAGKPLYGGSARTRVAIAKEYGRYLVALGTIYALGQFAGAEIELDPRSTDFGKLKFGNTRTDLMGGLSQNTVLLSRLATRQVKTLSGEVKELKEPVKFGQPNVVSVAGNFLRTKLAPIPGGLLDFWNGRNVAGEVVAPQDVLERQVQPMALRDIYDVMVADGVPKAAALGLLAILGAGLQQYDDPKVRAAVSKYMHNVHGGTPAQREMMRQELMRNAR